MARRCWKQPIVSERLNLHFQPELKFQRIPVLSNVGGVFQKRNPGQQAGLSLSRLLTQIGLGQMQYESGRGPVAELIVLVMSR